MQATTTSTTSRASTCHGTRRAATFHRRECVRQLAQAAAATIAGQPAAWPDAAEPGEEVRQAAEALRAMGMGVEFHTG